MAIRHLLAPPRALPPEPASVMRVVDRLGSLQFDPLDIAGRNHDLTLLARIDGYRRAWTDALLYESRDLYETYNKQFSLVPTAGLPWFRLTWDRHHAAHTGGAFDDHAPLVEELLERIRTHGPTSATDLEPREAIDWYWRPTNPVRAILEALAEAGVLAISRREGNRRIYDLTERLFPATLLAEHPSEDEQRRHLLLSRYRGNGLLGASGDYSLWMGLGKTPVRFATRDQLIERGELVGVEVDGFRGPRYVLRDELPFLEQAAAEVEAEGEMDAWQLGRPGDAEAGVAFIAPLDPLAWDRDQLSRLWDFDYRWEVYVPAAKRRWGYYVLPLLYGDRFVGRIEPKVDRATGTLRILGLWWEAGFDPLDEANPGFVASLADALRAHMAFGGVRKVAMPRTAAHAPLAKAVRAAMAECAERVAS
jgi:uncharacterized protein YcaQ